MGPMARKVFSKIAIATGKSLFLVHFGSKLGLGGRESSNALVNIRLH